MGTRRLRRRFVDPVVHKVLLIRSLVTTDIDEQRAMINDDAHVFVTDRYHCVAVRRDRCFGHALEVSVHGRVSGDLFNRLVFGCHPEFAGYDELQAMSTDQLITLAQDRLASGALDASLADPQTRGWTLYLRFEVSAP
ncbi:hypothetical protein BRAO375_1570005 [Bradyrhizobium sp. ORS 375]|uniref:hypothetical protein n=1 Tax=Bradyrhizobium sp. (strain ORS 375) TaxID=566679 RepID=UPI0002408AE7|nr:hypothetical protein [Bradyrhizobium sp. ORS 375]CCD91532.1 hypothetical protein BRAO375_1570005 [Bradyrhizobium sp. ORS 375]